MKVPYVYEAHDASPLSNLVYRPVINWIHKNFLPDISPHLITIAGAISVGLAWVVNVSSDHYKVNGLIIALLLLFYQLCDALDGIQARRKNQACAFGEFLDHSCDGLCAILIYFLTNNAVNSSSLVSVLFALIYWNHIFLDHLQRSILGKFHFDVISGPTDGIFILATMFLYKAWYGESIFNFIWADVIKIFFLLAGAFSLSCKAGVIYQQRKRTQINHWIPIMYPPITSVLYVIGISSPCIAKSGDKSLVYYCLNMCAGSLMLTLLKLLNDNFLNLHLLCAITIRAAHQVCVLIRLGFSIEGDFFSHYSSAIFLSYIIGIGMYKLHDITGNY